MVGPGEKHSEASLLSPAKRDHGDPCTMTLASLYVEWTQQRTYITCITRMTCVKSEIIDCAHNTAIKDPRRTFSSEGLPTDPDILVHHKKVSRSSV